MKTFDVDQFNMSISRQLVGQSILKKGGLLVPGHAVEERKFWQNRNLKLFSTRALPSSCCRS
ncbi:unnamed protein product [Paramecium primaurelia]|uniref:Uncharacterized protein n=1 Tax=Paramecium primaurelia TaxID=5886 RepID=A0A8S1LEZ9_PARPR|nr:unnamed protein product [Paramecium primaurelia]